MKVKLSRWRDDLQMCMLLEDGANLRISSQFFCLKWDLLRSGGRGLEGFVEE